MKRIVIERSGGYRRLQIKKFSKPTPRSSLGKICGDKCTFLLKDGITRPLPEQANHLICGGDKELVNSTIENHTTAKLILQKNVRNCTIRSKGPVEDNGSRNRVEMIER